MEDKSGRMTQQIYHNQKLRRVYELVRISPKAKSLVNFTTFKSKINGGVKNIF